MLITWPYGEEAARLNPGREIVGLGFQVRDPVEAARDPFAAFGADLHWQPLVNEAEASSMAEEFFVSGEQLKGVLTHLLSELGDGNVRPYVLWHSHWKGAGPSGFDLQHFPAWLVPTGAIFHVPSDTTVLYDKDGLIPTGRLTVRESIAVSYGSMH